MDLIRARQHRTNAETRDRWVPFAEHRRRVTALALRGGGPGRRLCVLGAGNCNDLELVAALHQFREVHLVDLDAGALEAAAVRQEVTRFPGLRRHGDVELSGLASVLDTLPAAPVESRADALVAALAAADPALPAGPFDVVLSACLLTQMIEPVIEVLGADQPRLTGALATLRRRHLELMLGLTATGGTAVLVSDMVSSDTVPGLAETPANRVKDLMARLVREHNFFSGANPMALLQALGEPSLGGMVERADVVEPWIWRLGPARSLLVYAVVLRRRSAG